MAKEAGEKGGGKTNVAKNTANAGVAPSKTATKGGRKPTADAVTKKTSRAEDGHPRAPEDQTSIAERALAMKNSAPKAQRPTTRTSQKGMPSIPNYDPPEGGADTEGGGRPSLGRARGR